MDKTTLNKFLKQLSHLNFGHSAWLLINGFKSAEKNVNVEELPFYNEERYKKLQENPVSIISETCMGGVLYHQMGLRFDTPFINVRIGLERNDYFKLLNHLNEYMNQAPSIMPGKKYEGVDFTGWEGRIDFPRLWYDDILIHGFHYNSTEEMLEIWEKRRLRYRADNTAVLKILYDDVDVEKFELLPFKRKLGFYFKDTPYDNILTLNSPMVKNKYAYQYASYIYNVIASGEFLKYFDIFKFLTE